MTGNLWAELTLHEGIQLAPEPLREAVDSVRKLAIEGQLSIEAKALHFQRGQAFLDWIKEAKVEYEASEVKQ